MKINTAELIGDALDWAVHKAEGYEWPWKGSGYLPSRVWDHEVGNLIERERISINFTPMGVSADIREGWEAKGTMYADDPLVAVARCYVAYKLGHVVDIPEELVAK